MVTKADEYRTLKEMNKKIQTKEFKVISQVKLSIEMQDNNITDLDKKLRQALGKR
jgi:2C-methyl-D-erythritol 2,4-cyclodiphosphate synthase